MLSLAPDLLAGSRRALARAITLVESTREDHAQAAQALLANLLPHTGGAVRVGLTGVPGVGKSTFIEALGLRLLERGHTVAVLAVDPSSGRTGGSILGDKTRMPGLSAHPHAFVRPSPSSGALGGVARRTREAMLLCEAAGFDVVLVETVGVGQSETAVAAMTDLFALLTLPNAGDELQGIKRGVMELADLILVNKSDLDAGAARRAQADLRAAVHLFTPTSAPWQPRVLGVSATTGDGLDAAWQAVLDHRAALGVAGLQERRRAQTLTWFDDLLREAVWARFQRGVDPNDLASVRASVEAERLTPMQGVQRLLAPQEGAAGAPAAPPQGLT